MRTIMDPKNPSPFKQPFLCLAMVKRGRQPSDFWLVDVDGKIGRYMTSDRTKPKQPLLDLCKMLASNGLRVVYYGSYERPAGSTHILRNGAMFCRIWKEFESDSAAERILPSEKFVPPTYNQYIW